MNSPSENILRTLLVSRRFFDGNRPLTHMFFGNRKHQKCWKLSLSREDRARMYEAYIDYCSQSTEDMLCGEGLNSLTEKAPPVFKFYVDLELSVDHFVNNIIKVEQVPTLMQKTKKIFMQVLHEAFGKEFECISAFRTFYKCHLYMPDVYLDAPRAKIICHDVQSRLSKDYPWIVSKNMGDFIDTSVYKSGLRMIYSHKGIIEKPTNRAKHVEFFGETVPYEYYYRVGEILDDNRIRWQKDQMTLDNLVRISIIPEEDSVQAMEFTSTYETAVKSISPIRQTAKLTPQKRPLPKIDAVDMNHAKRNGDEHNQEKHNVSDQDLDQERTQEMVRAYVNDVLPKLGLQTGIHNIRKNQYGSILVVLEPQPCPFAKREHRRTSDKGTSATYMVINAFECTVRCFDELCTEMITLPSPKEELMDLLCNCTKHFALKQSLYKQTHETVTEYIFSMVKRSYATSPARDSSGTSFLWYFYEENEHRWVQQEKIMTTIMSERGSVQRSYRSYVEQVRNDPNLTEETIKSTRDLWAKLEVQLQTTSFVRAGIIPLLARKLEQYWSKIIKGATHSLKQGRGATFQSTLDDNPNLMGFVNGVWDFRKRQFRRGNPLDFISMSTNLVYQPYSAFSPELKNELFTALKKIYPKDNHLEYVLCEIASCLNGTTDQQRFFLMTGHGANGKSTLVRLLNLAFGDYAGEVNITLFTKPRPPANVPSPELIAIKGQRFVSSSEPNAREPFNLGTIKWLTGGDRITAAQKFEKNQSFYLQSTFFSLINDIPPIQASKEDYGTWRRMKPIEHLAKFVKEPDPNNPYEFKDDMTINHRMENWKELFISYLIQIFLDRKVCREPEEFIQLHLKLQGDSDIFSRFVDQFVIKNTDDFMDILSLFEGFTNWNKIVRLSKKDISINHFEKHMLNLIGSYVEDEDGNKGWNVSLKKLPNVYF
jgi:P4 family phage/plasmid primase-like protien